MRYFGEATDLPVSQQGTPVTEGGAQQTSTTAGGGSVLQTFVDILGRTVDQYGKPVVPAQPPPSQTPLWVWIALPVGGLVLLGVASRMLRRKRK